MDADVKTKWLEALRSGKYIQGKYQLCDGKNYCCLGVLAQVMEIPKGPTGESFNFPEYGYVGGYLPSDYCGITNTNQRELSQMNDTGKTFLEIATWIEENL